MSAVSNRVTPRSIALWMTLREVSRSVRWPKLLQPMPTAETRRPEPPRLRICIRTVLSGIWGRRGVHCDARTVARQDADLLRYRMPDRRGAMQQKRESILQKNTKKTQKQRSRMSLRSKKQQSITPAFDR